jgi:hypothetical protein
MAVTVEYGQCDRCGDNNVKTATICRSCGQRLPWAKAPAEKKVASSSAKPSSAPKIDMGNYAWGPMGVQLFGGAVFLGGLAARIAMIAGTIPYIPFAGYFIMVVGAAIWKAGSNME